MTKKYKIPVQSLIDHIKTATDVDPWAKEMAEELLKEQEAVSIKCITKRALDDDSNDEPVYSNDRFYDCPHCGQRLSRTYPNKDIKYCWKCGQAVKWE